MDIVPRFTALFLQVGQFLSWETILQTFLCFWIPRSLPASEESSWPLSLFYLTLCRWSSPQASAWWQSVFLWWCPEDHSIHHSTVATRAFPSVVSLVRVTLSAFFAPFKAKTSELMPLCPPVPTGMQGFSAASPSCPELFFSPHSASQLLEKLNSNTSDHLQGTPLFDTQQMHT